MRKKIVGSSWKMHLTSVDDCIVLANAMAQCVGTVDDVEIFFLPPFPMIPTLAKAFEHTKIGWGAQNVCFAEQGAFTGEVPPQMLKDFGCRYVEMGHAERRAMFNETDKTVNLKVKAALKYDMAPVVCIGETKEDKESGYSDVRLKTQVAWALDGLNEQKMGKVILAYEPVWAIGQQKGADPEYVNDVHKKVRGFIADTYGGSAAKSIRIIYGGSVTPESSKELICYDDIDGLFIGRFGLKAENFKAIVDAALACIHK